MSRVLGEGPGSVRSTSRKAMPFCPQRSWRCLALKPHESSPGRLPGEPQRARNWGCPAESLSGGWQPEGTQPPRWGRLLPPAGLPRAWAHLVRCHRGSPRCSPRRWGGPQRSSSQGGPLGGEARRCLEEANSGRLQILQRQEGEGQLTSSVRGGRKSRPGVREALWLITSQKK